jgi:hypothetical protein
MEYKQRYETCQRCKKWPDEGAAPAMLVCEEYIQQPLIEKALRCDCPCCRRHDVEVGRAKAAEPEEKNHHYEQDEQKRGPHAKLILPTLLDIV